MQGAEPACHNVGVFASRTNWNLEENRLSVLAAGRRRAGTLLDLTVSNPTRCGLDYGDEVLAALRHPEALIYRPDPFGLLAAREAVAEYYRGRGMAVSPDDLVLTASTSEAYSHLFRLLCDPGDRVHIPRPGYPLFELLAAVNDVRLSAYPLFYDHGWHVDVGALEGQLDSRSRAILMVHPNNPTGSYVRPGEWEALQTLAARHDLALIVDEVFFDYPLTAHPERVEDPRSQRALTFTLNGLSKISALPQMKLGWMVLSGPEQQKRQARSRLEIINDTYLSVDTPVQWAAGTLLAHRHRMQPQIRARAAANLACLDEQMAGPEAGGLMGRLEVEGGWTAIVRLPRVRTDAEWAEGLVEQAGVLVHPGHFYDFADEGHVVVSLLVKEEVFAEGVRRLVEWVRSAVV